MLAAERLAEEMQCKGYYRVVLFCFFNYGKTGDKATEHGRRGVRAMSGKTSPWRKSPCKNVSVQVSGTRDLLQTNKQTNNPAGRKDPLTHPSYTSASYLSILDISPCLPYDCQFSFQIVSWKVSSGHKDNLHFFL